MGRKYQVISGDGHVETPPESCRQVLMNYPTIDRHASPFRRFFREVSIQIILDVGRGRPARSRGEGPGPAGTAPGNAIPCVAGRRP